MIAAEDFERLFKRLCKRFGKKMNPDQAEIYYDCLSNCNKKRLDEAIDKVIRGEKYWPTPGQIEETYLILKNKSEPESKVCEYCEAGFVFFQMDGKRFANPCAHCNEISTAHLVAKMGDIIFWAYQSTQQKCDGSPVLRSNLNNMQRIKGAMFSVAATRNPKFQPRADTELLHCNT